VPKIKLDPHLYERARQVAQAAGYASTEEFIVHLIEKELARIGPADDAKQVEERLRGLGYIE